MDPKTKGEESERDASAPSSDRRHTILLGSRETYEPGPDQPAATVLSAQVDPSTGLTKRKYRPPPKQLQGGSWVLDEVCRIWHLSSAYYDPEGSMVPSPRDPSVVQGYYQTIADMAREGNFIMPLEDVPEEFFHPHEVLTPSQIATAFCDTLCKECAYLLDMVLMSLFRDDMKKAPQNTIVDINAKPSFLELKQSAEGGCTFCKFLIGVFQLMSQYQMEKHRSESEECDFPIQIIGQNSPTGYFRMMVWLRHAKEINFHKRTKAFDLLAHLPRPPTFPEFASHIGVRLGEKFISKEGLKIAQHWLDECVHNHKLCQKYASSNPRLPSRVVDVGDVFTAPFLVETNGETGHYLALSYCWGSATGITTTLENIDSHKIGIPLHAMAPTIRHAVLLARSFGVRYIWIDALCIIQDSKVDWDTESVSMGEIYRDAYFIIAAARSQSSLEGIFPDLPERQDPVRIKIKPPIELYIDSVPLDWDSCVEHDALSHRGWVLQERLLSCRTLFFSTQQLFWECKSERRSQHQYSRLKENEQNSLSPQPKSVFNAIPERSKIHHLPLRQETPASTGLVNPLWYKMLEAYTTKSLTFPSDKLPAIAGLARLVDPGDGAYVAGTWLKSWQVDILWRAVSAGSLRAPKGLSAARCPSWSWASLDGPIQFFKISGAKSVEDTAFISTSPHSARLLSVSHTTSDYLGKVTDVALEIEGYAEWVTARSTPAKLAPPSSYNEWTGVYDEVTENWAYTMDTTFDEPRRCLRLLIFSMGGTRDHRGSCFALLLQPLDNAERRWKRVGEGVADSYLVDFTKLLEGKWRSITLV